MGEELSFNFYSIYIITRTPIAFSGILHWSIKHKKMQFDSYRKIAPKAKWHWIGILGMIACFILLSFYSVIGGWIIIYLYKAVTGQLNGLSSDQYTQVFGDTISDPIISLIVQLLFILMTLLLLQEGFKKGLNKQVRL